MKKLTAVVVSLMLLLNSIVPTMASNKNDVDGHWASEELMEWSDYGVINGYPDGLMRPDNKVTRAEIVKMLDNLFQFNSIQVGVKFTDVSPDDWFADELQRANSHGIINGYPDGSFRGEEAMTREHVIMVLYKAFKFEDENLSLESVKQFKDSDKISASALEAVAYFAKMGYVKGYSDGSLKPQGLITRAEAIKLIDNLVGLYCNEDNKVIEAMTVNNVLVTGKNVILKNIIIENSLTITEAVEDSDVTLESVTVNGTTHVNGGGSHSIKIDDSKMGLMIVDKATGESVRILVTGNSTVNDLVAKNTIIIEDQTIGIGQGILKITLSKDIPVEAIVELIGDFLQVNVEADSLKIVLDGFIKLLNNLGIDVKINDKPVVKGSDQIFVSTPDTSSSSNNQTSEWTLSWSDEFNSTSIDNSKWTYDIGNWIVDDEGNGIASGWGNNEKEYYTNSAKNSYIEDGKLVIKAIKEAASDEFGNYDYTSAKLKTKGLFSQTYGRYEISAKLPVGKGLWPAIWMLPEEDVYGGWAASGEIDIMEGWGSRPDTVAGTLHYGGLWPANKYSGDEFVFPETTSVNEFHEYAIEWEPGVIRWYVDNELYQTQDNWNTKDENGEKFSFPAPFDQDFYLIMNLAVGGNFDGEPTDDTPFPSTMEVDYVRVYELTGREYSTPVEPAQESEALPEGAKVADDEGNYISNGDFTEAIQDNPEASLAFGDQWNFVHMDQFGGEGSQSIDTIDGTNYAKIDISNGGSQNYSVQLIQLTTLGKGRYYKVSFDAKAAAARTMNMKMGGGADAGWSVYSDSYVMNLTDSVQHYEETFQMTNDSDIAARLEFNVGSSTTSVWIGNVKVEEVDAPEIDYSAAKEPLEDGNTIYNSAFDKYTIDRLGYWNFVTQSASAVGLVDESTKQFVATILDGGSNVEAIQLNQVGLQLDALTEYELTFDARYKTARDIVVEVVNADGTVEYLPAETVTLDAEMTTYTFSFVMPETADTTARINFNLGGNNGDVVLDNIKLIKGEAAEEPDIEDGFDVITFDSEADLWTGWWGDEWSGYSSGTITTSSAAMKVELDSVGFASYSPQVFYEGFALVNGETYTVSFDVYADADRQMNLNIGKALSGDPWFTNYMETEVVDITTEVQNISYEFTVTEATDENLKMVFELGTIASQGVLTSVYFDNIAITKNLSKPIETITFDSEADTWDSWWGDEWSGYSSGTVRTTSGALEVELTSVGFASYSPQVFYEGFGLEKDKTYEVSFDAYADAARQINLNIGKALPSAPWFINYMSTEVVDITTSLQHFSYEFTVTEDTEANLKMVYELGTISGNGIVTTLYFDNITIIEK